MYQSDVCTSLMSVRVQGLYHSDLYTSPTFVPVQRLHQSDVGTSLTFVPVQRLYQSDIVPIRHCTNIVPVQGLHLSSICSSLTFLPVWLLYSPTFVMYDVFVSNVCCGTTTCKLRLPLIFFYFKVWILLSALMVKPGQDLDQK